MQSSKLISRKNSKGRETLSNKYSGQIYMNLCIFQDIIEFIKQAQERVLSHQEDQALLKAYIAEWRKFFTQCSYLPMPFGQLETSLQGKTSSIQKTKQNEHESVVRKLMLDSWNQSIFSNIKERLQVLK